MSITTREDQTAKGYWNSQRGSDLLITFALCSIARQGLIITWLTRYLTWPTCPFPDLPGGRALHLTWTYTHIMVRGWDVGLEASLHISELNSAIDIYRWKRLDEAHWIVANLHCYTALAYPWTNIICSPYGSETAGSDPSDTGFSHRPYTHPTPTDPNFSMGYVEYLRRTLGLVE